MITAALSSRPAQLAMYDALEARMLTRAACALREAGIQLLLFKGAAVGRTTYERSWERARSDADALIRADTWAAADSVLQLVIGPRVQDAIDPRVMGQWQYRDRETGLLLDLHCRLFEPPPLAALVTFDELYATSVGVPDLSPVRAPNSVYALWIAVIHPVAHHDAAADPVWDEDLRRISAQFDSQSWLAFAALARRTATCAICSHSLRRAGVAIPMTVSEELAVENEPTAHLLTQRNQSAIAKQVLILRAMPGWRVRWTELRRRVFPPAAYMRDRYGAISHSGLVAAYIWRIVAGLAGPWREASASPRDRFGSDGT